MSWVWFTTFPWNVWNIFTKFNPFYRICDDIYCSIFLMRRPNCQRIYSLTALALPPKSFLSFYLCWRIILNKIGKRSSNKGQYYKKYQIHKKLLINLSRKKTDLQSSIKEKKPIIPIKSIYQFFQIFLFLFLQFHYCK